MDLCLLRPPYLYGTGAQGCFGLSPRAIEGWLHDVSVLHLYTPLREYGAGSDAYTSRQADAPRGGRSRDYDDYRQAVRYDGALLFTPPRYPTPTVHTSGDAVTTASKKVTKQKKSPWLPTGFSFSISLAKQLTLRLIHWVCCVSYCESTEFES